ncbi:MAG: hypothetical protein ABIO46_06430 [Chitinophagales bacterium]
MRIYIASSRRNQHAREMLSTMMLLKGHEVFSIEGHSAPEEQISDLPVDFAEWNSTEYANHSFELHTKSAMSADLIIYIGPSGKDAAAVCGMAFAKGIAIFGLFEKSEDFGLMRKMMVRWFEHYDDMFKEIDAYSDVLEAAGIKIGT